MKITEDNFNWVEALEESLNNQRCKWGNLVTGHSVYCHCPHEDAPRKCRHTWYYGKDEKGMQDEDCPLFEPNPDYKAEE